MKKILLCSRGLLNPAGGGESAGYKLYKNILEINKKKKKFKIYILTDLRNTKVKLSSANVFFFSTLKFKIPVFNFFIDNYFFERKIKELEKLYNYDIIHVQGWSGYYPSLKSNAKKVLTLHDDLYTDLPFFRKDFLGIFVSLWYKVGKYIRLKNYSKYDYYHALSSRIKNALILQGIHEKNIKVLHNGVEKKREKSSMKSRKINKNRNILMLGKVEYRKGVHLVAKAMQSLPEDYHLYIVGKIVPIFGLNYLKNLCSLSNQIHYLGYISNEQLSKLMTKMDCFISASYYEACQLSPLEAISNQLNVIATKAGAILDIFKKEYPLLINSYYSEEIANKILKSFDIDLDEKKYLIGNFKSWKETSDEIYKFYSKIINT
jgi:glycosyltransferase involved in cell wall biosynthesis